VATLGLLLLLALVLVLWLMERRDWPGGQRRRRVERSRLLRRELRV
jgi:hypothetical protein